MSECTCIVVSTVAERDTDKLADMAELQWPATADGRPTAAFGRPTVAWTVAAVSFLATVGNSKESYM